MGQGRIVTNLLVLVFIGVINSDVSEAKTVCYTLAGSGSDTCFSNDPPFDNAANFLPKSPSQVGTKFFLYTRKGSSKEQIYTDNLASSALLQRRDTKIIIHGYTESENAGWILPMVQAFLGVGDFNVIVVDWSGGAKLLNYYQCVANTRLVGAQVGLLIKALDDTYKISSSNVHIVGLSLGAHTAGYAGKSVSGIGRISGLDPAGPAFYSDEPQVRLTKNDAAYVDILHTNGEPSLRKGLGLFDALGTVDFYPNGGRKQPGCSQGDPATTAVPTTNPLSGTETSGTACNHKRAGYLYTETIKSNCPFNAYPCDPGSVCDTCGNKGCSRMGYYSLQDGASGSYYLTTTGVSPFC